MGDVSVTFVRGARYFVKYKLPRCQPRYFVGVYLGINEVTGELDFSLRPQLGTSSIEAKYIVRYVQSNEPCGVYKDES